MRVLKYKSSTKELFNGFHSTIANAALIPNTYFDSHVPEQKPRTADDSKLSHPHVAHDPSHTARLMVFTLGLKGLDISNEWWRPA